MIIPIRHFGGMLTNPQGEDINDFSSEWNLNCDPETQSQLRGIADNGAAYQANGNVEIPDATESRLIKYNASGTMKWDLVYLDKEDNDISVVENFHDGTEGNRTFNDIVTSPNGTASTIDTFGNSAQIGMGNGDGERPYVVYRLLNDRKFFDDNFTASAGVFAHYGECNNQDIVFAVNNVTQTTPLQVNFTQVFGGGVVNHRMLKGDRVEIRGVVGATGANGIFTVSILSDTVVTLDGTSSGGAYSSGGTCYGGWCQIASLTYNVAAGYFAADTLYAYGVSLVYDGLQNSNLLTTYDSVLSSVSNGGAGDTITLAIQVLAAASGRSMFADSLFDKRVTAVKVWRAECSTGDESPQNLGLYRLVDTIDINKGLGEVNWSSVGVFSYVDNGGYPGGGQTYEEETGFLGTTERTYVHYGLNTTGGGYHWMAQPYVSTPGTSGGVPTPIDWDRYIFRSMKYRPNMVNWVEGNHLTLPEIPVELKYYENYLYAFTENNLYKIHPGLLIYDTFEGVGISKQGGVVVTENGMFFCNLNGAYRLFNNQITTITDNIKISLGNYTVNWLEFAKDCFTTPAHLGRIIVAYLADKRSVIFMGSAGTATTYAFVYYLPTEEWYTWNFGSVTIDSNSGVVTGKDGELYISGDTSLYKLLGGSGNQDCDWVSKEFTLGKPSQNKLWGKMKWDGDAGTGSIVVKYNTNGGDPLTGATATSDTYFNIYKKTFQAYFDLGGNATVDSTDILVRELEGER